MVLDCPDRWNVTEKIYKHVEERMAFEGMAMKEFASKNEEYSFEKEEIQFEMKI